jgi:hypothetical protein
MRTSTRTILFFTIAAIALCEDPEANPFPTKFKMTFTETLTLKHGGTTQTTGVYYYDFSKKSHRLERQHSANDRFCGNILPFVDTPCHQIVVETGER